MKFTISNMQSKITRHSKWKGNATCNKGKIPSLEIPRNDKNDRISK